MIQIQFDGNTLPPNAASQVTLKPLTTPVGPSEILVGTTPKLLFDASAAESATGFASLENKASFQISICMGTTGTPNLTTANGTDLLDGAYVTIDDIGGLCLWGISGTVQSAGSGVRVMGGYA